MGEGVSSLSEAAKRLLQSALQRCMVGSGSWEFGYSRAMIVG